MTTNWIDAAAQDDVPQDDVIGVAVDGHDIALYGVDGEVFATDIECPLHQGKFDVRSGQPTCAPATEALRTYPVKIEGGRVWLALD